MLIIQGTFSFVRKCFKWTLFGLKFIICFLTNSLICKHYWNLNVTFNNNKVEASVLEMMKRLLFSWISECAPPLNDPKKPFLPVEAVREACLASGLSDSSAQSFKGKGGGGKKLNSSRRMSSSFVTCTCSSPRGITICMSRTTRLRSVN